MGRSREKIFKMTPQRLAILECLEGNKNHPSAEDIYRNVKEKYPTMSFATVYNNLEALCTRGRIMSLTIDAERMRYDPDTSYHHHLICLDCSKIIDVKADIQPRISNEQKAGFKVLGNHIEFYGTCADCRNVGAKSRSIKKAAN